jgi:hypothetical protein
MRRRQLAVALVALAGIVVAVVVAIFTVAHMHEAERTAAATLAAVFDSQRAFRARGGQGGYAVDLASLTTPCPGSGAAALSTGALLEPKDYQFVVRAARAANQVGTDCHGRPSASDFYAAAEPRGPLAGRQAMAMTSRGRIYVFFDGIAPLEADMGPDGLAVPLETLDSFKIP